jgi:hypothetical protein
MVTAYSQRDTEWSHEKLGTNPPTIGEVGCLMTSMASVVTDLTSYSMAPGYFNHWLRDNKGYASGNLFAFGSVAPLGLKLTALVRAQSGAIDLDTLTKALDDGAAVVLQVDSTPGGTLNQHWVRAISLTETDGQIMDPWQLPGKELTKLSIYFARGWKTKQAIFIGAIYKKAAGVRALARAGELPVAADAPTPEPDDPAAAILGEEFQPFLCPRPLDE